MRKRREVKAANQGKLVSIGIKQACITRSKLVGKDLFWIGTVGAETYVSERLVEALRKEQITGVEFDVADDIDQVLALGSGRVSFTPKASGPTCRGGGNAGIACNYLLHVAGSYAQCRASGPSICFGGPEALANATLAKYASVNSGRLARDGVLRFNGGW